MPEQNMRRIIWKCILTSSWLLKFSVNQFWNQTAFLSDLRFGVTFTSNQRHLQIYQTRNICKSIKPETFTNLPNQRHLQIYQIRTIYKSTKPEIFKNLSTQNYLQIYKTKDIYKSTKPETLTNLPNLSLKTLD